MKKLLKKLFKSIAIFMYTNKFRKLGFNSCESKMRACVLLEARLITYIRSLNNEFNPKEYIQNQIHSFIVMYYNKNDILCCLSVSAENFDQAESLVLMNRDVRDIFQITIQRSIYVCTGCGHRSDVPIEPPYMGCCPDNNYISLNEYLVNSFYKKPK
jgi:hypothetical protein